MALALRHEPKGKEKEEELLLYKLNDYYELVDALPYVDGFTDELKDEVKGLIQSEMATFQPHNYLNCLQPPRTPLLDAVFENTQASLESDGDVSMTNGNVNCQSSSGLGHSSYEYLWQKEIERLRQKSGSFQKLDMSRYEAPEPTDLNDVAAWKSSLKNLKAQVENSSSRLLNLDLAFKYAQPSWMRHMSDLEGHEAATKKQAAEISKKIEDINKKRKLDQITAGNELRNLSREYEDVFDRNLVILPVIHKLRQEVTELEKSEEH